MCDRAISVIALSQLGRASPPKGEGALCCCALPPLHRSSLSARAVPFRIWH